ncbi:MAG TPA: UTRA domain-containing protein [Caulobacteraceae bacterium]
MNYNAPEQTQVAPSHAPKPDAAAIAVERLTSLVLDGQGPAWLQIRRALARPIANGDWAPGTYIPSELSLRDHFGTSRMTVSKAVQSLAAEGIVERRRKTGTVVSVRAQERPVFEIWDTADVIARNGGHYSYQLISCAFIDDEPEMREMLGVGREAPLIRILCAHFSDGRPFQLEERIVNVDAAPGITCQPLETIGPSPWLLAHVPWTQAEHVISACEADAEIVEHLHVAPGSACLLVERRTWNGDVPVTVARLWHPGARHRLVGRFEPHR